VMIAISSSGTSAPKACSAKTSLGFGHGTVVEMRTFMYETRKHVNMNVSLTRKIHIIALPHGTWKVCLACDQAETMLRQPSADSSCAIALTPCCAMALVSSRSPGPRRCVRSRRSAALCGSLRSGRHQQPEQTDPDDEQKMPVRRAQADAHIGADQRIGVARVERAHPKSRSSEHEKTADEMQPVDRRQQNEEGVRGRL